MTRKRNITIRVYYFGLYSLKIYVQKSLVLVVHLIKKKYKVVD